MTTTAVQARAAKAARSARAPNALGAKDPPPAGAAFLFPRRGGVAARGLRPSRSRARRPADWAFASPTLPSSGVAAVGTTRRRGPGNARSDRSPSRKVRSKRLPRASSQRRRTFGPTAFNRRALSRAEPPASVRRLPESAERSYLHLELSFIEHVFIHDSERSNTCPVLSLERFP